MNEILVKYKDRLINLSGRNRSLVSKTLPKLRAFDLHKLEEFSDGFIEDILSFIINRKTKEFLILPDYTSYYSETLRILVSEVSRQKKEEVSQVNKDALAKPEKEQRVALINNKYDEKLQKEQVKLSEKREKIIDYSVSLRTLQKEISSIVKETGRSELYVGYPFVEGNLKDGTFIRAPLYMFPVSLIRDGDSYLLDNKEEATIYLNKVLLLAICKHNEIKLNGVETEFDSLEDGFIEKTLEILKSNNIIIENCNNEIVGFKEYKKDNIPSFELGQLRLTYNLILGQFPIANSIYADYESMLSMDINNKLLEDLLIATSIKEINSLEEVEEHGKLSFSEEDLCLISSLDFSQEKAVKLANESDKLVIYGPPGTGKSQTIANIISNALAKDKTVLMVSQKRAALDVIYNRLAKLNAKALLIHDTEGDKKSFYGSVAQSLEVLGQDNNDKEYEQEIIKLSKDIDKKIECLEVLAEALHKDRPFGLTLQEMYSKTKAIKSREDGRYSSYSRFRQQNVFKNYTYSDLKAAVEGLKEREVLCYKTYRELLDKNPFIDDVDLNMNFMDIDELSLKVKNIIEPIKRITDKAISEGEVYHRLMAALKTNSYVLSEDKVSLEIETINKDKNGILLKPINDGKWWSIKYWMNYSANKKQEEANRVEYENRNKELDQRIRSLHKEIKAAFEDISIVKKALNERVYNLVIEELLKGEDLTLYFNDIIDALYTIEEFKAQLKTIKSLNEIQTKIMNYALNEDVKLMKRSIEGLLEFMILYHISEIEKEDVAQRAVEYLVSFKELVSDVNVEIEEKRNVVREFILSKWNNNIEKIEVEKGYKEFKRQANKKRALLPIRKYLEDYNEMILNVFPCFLLSPETVSEILPLQEGLFDIIIFDEASQMYIENAIPTIFRGKQVIIAGDDKQLRPNGTFNNRFIDEEEEYEQETSAALEEESLLDLAKINFKGVHLNYHYRSSFEELINFSNYAFYEGRLKISPNVNTISDYGLPIERIMVDGKWINRANIEEAEMVANIVEKLLMERKCNETIGIITFNINQRTAIEDMLEKRARDNAEFRQLYIKEIDRYEDNEDASLFVKNIENVQGDERDIIIFSLGYGKNENGRVSVNFGSLSQDGGENRLNVAISRAKKKIYVVTSIEPEELNVENTKNEGPKLFKKYLQYVREISNGNKNEAQNILTSVLDTKFKNKEDIHYDSDFELEVYEALVKRGYEVHTQVGVSGYKIDLAIYDHRKEKYILGIECDGATYHSSKSARERDIHRQRYLESRGWKIARIWSYNWWSDSKGEIEKICNILIEGQDKVLK